MHESSFGLESGNALSKIAAGTEGPLGEV